MFNHTGIKKTTYGGPIQILFNVQNQMSVGVLVDDAYYVERDGRKIVPAGTPLYGDLTARTTPFAQSSIIGDTKGVFTLQITTAFAADEVLTIDGVNYTCKAVESVENNQFAGANAAAQITSLLKMVTTNKYAVASVAGATDKLGFTQKVADASDTTGPAVSKTASTGAIGSVTRVTPAVDGQSNAVGILLHDVDVTDGDNNGTLLIWGFVDLNKVDDTTAALITPQVKTTLGGKVTFLK